MESGISWAQRAIALAESSSKREFSATHWVRWARCASLPAMLRVWADLERALQIALDRDLQEQVASAYVESVRDGLPSPPIRQSVSVALATDLPIAKSAIWTGCDATCSRIAHAKVLSKATGRPPARTRRRCCAIPLSTPITRIPALRTLGHIRIRRGDPQAEAALEEAWALGGPAEELQRIGTWAAIRAEAAWLAGDREGVLKVAGQPAYEMVCRRSDPRMKGELADWSWRVRALERQPTDIADPEAQKITGDWRTVVFAWKSLGCRYEHACLLAWHGVETEQREALVILERLGAAPAAQALRKRMRSPGVRAVPRGSRVSTRSNRLGLTRREAEILKLVSQGLRNSAIAKRLFVSTRTVDRHVSAILSKLGVQSRGQAVAMASRSPGSPD